MVHEARGLDVQPKTLEKFSNHGDNESVKILEIIYKEEITHVAAGLRWFTYVCNNSDPPMWYLPLVKPKVPVCEEKPQDAVT
ncbi:hypothetical protein KUTeg_010837 [Tegillarca granosa]|uniref:Uncharacterized protein n=1 Tax=Tegillarca granosa TaxID=220873 RepID=A0ABQ9F273_TEGGR|nr:hypothetical protein KUTeg_010837 [Tegillarca granosa]